MLQFIYNSNFILGGIIVKKFYFDKRYLALSLYALAVIIIAITFQNIFDKFDNIKLFFKNIVNILSPFLIGFFLAYLMNPLVSFFERMLAKIKLFKDDKKFKLKRGISVLVSYVLIIVLLFWFISYLIPEITKNFYALFNGLDKAVVNLEIYLQNLADKYPELFNSDFENGINAIFDEILSTLSSLSSTIGTMLGKFATGLGSTVSTVVSGTVFVTQKVINIILAVIISIYVLLDKEIFLKQALRFTYAVFPVFIADKLHFLVREVDDTFEKFLVGKIIDSIIVAIICFIGLLIFKIPYALIISILVGVTNVIPYFGPFIGAIPSVVITLFTGGIWSALFVLIFILILQQIDGNIIGPKIIGDSTGLGPFWIIFAITIGGALAGVIGMFIAVPIFAVIYSLAEAAIDKNISKKTENNPELAEKLKGDK